MSEQAPVAISADERLRKALAAWFIADPWQRADPGDGLSQTDEPWECYACGATSPYTYPDPSQPNWYEKPVIDAAHDEDCLWDAARAALGAAPDEPDALRLFKAAQRADVLLSATEATALAAALVEIDR
jgi:hypothetical protein